MQRVFTRLPSSACYWYGGHLVSKSSIKVSFLAVSKPQFCELKAIESRGAPTPTFSQEPEFSKGFLLLMRLSKPGLRINLSSRG